MRRLGVAIIAAAFSLLLVVVPVSTTPAQAAQTVRTLACYSSLTCNQANLPLLAEAGLVSGGGGAAAATAATGGTAAAVGTGAAGTLGWYTVMGAVVAGLGLMTIKGVEEGVNIETDPQWSQGTSGWPVLVTPNGALAVEVAWGPLYMNTPPSQYICVRRVAAQENGTTPGGSTLWFKLTDGTYDSSSIRGVGGSSTVSTSVNACNGALGTTGGSWSNSLALSSSDPYEINVESMAVCGGPVPTCTMTTVAPIRPLDVYFKTRNAVSSGYHGMLRTDVVCRVSGGTPTTTSFEARVDAEAGDDLPVPPAQCAAGVAIGSKVYYLEDGSSTWVELGGVDADYVSDYLDEYPGCFASSQGSTCTVELERKEGTRWETCGKLASYCPDWVEEWSSTPEIYRCKFGEYAVSIDVCSMYRKPGVLLPNVEHDPGESPQPIPPTAPAPNPLPNPVKNPDGTTPETPPWIDVDGGPDPSQDPRECWPTGWGVLNPLAWVFMPVKCALEDAFVPRQSEIVKIQNRVKTALAGTSVEQVQQIASSGLATIGEIPKTGCLGPHVVLNVPSINPFPGTHPPLIDYDGYPLSACEAPYDAAAFWARTIGGLIMLWFGGKLVLRNIAGIIDYSGRGPV